MSASASESRGEKPPPRRRLLARGAGARVCRGAHLGLRSRVAGGLCHQARGAPEPLCGGGGGGGGRAARRGMAAAPRARGWAPRPVPLLPLLLLLPAACAAAREPPEAARLSLHPPYFNLAEAARIWATATCGEPGLGSARPRPELYCKLVGGPTAPGSGRTIQVRSRESAKGGGEPGPGSFPVRVGHLRRDWALSSPALVTSGYREGLPPTPARAGDPRIGARRRRSDLAGVPPSRTRRPRWGWVKHAR